MVVVTLCTQRLLPAFVAVHWIVGGKAFDISVITVHFRRGVAIGAFHAPLAEVHIGFDIFVLAHILVANAAAVASGAVAGKRGRRIEVMPIDQAAAD